MKNLKYTVKEINNIKYWTIVHKDTFANFSKNTNKAVAIDINRAKDIIKKYWDILEVDPTKSYTVNFLYRDIWRASKSFKDNVKFPDDDVKDTNQNTDLYDYVYGIQLIIR